MTHVLLIGHEASPHDGVGSGLVDEGIEVSTAPNAEAGLQLVTNEDVDLLVIDLTPPSGGIKLLQEVRKLRPRLPIFALSSLDDTGSLVVGLEAGADEYLTKPVSPGKLAARIRARLRREEKAETLTSGPFTLDLAAHHLELSGRSIELSARELGLLATFMRNEGKVLSQSELLKAVWNLDFDPGSNVVQVYVRSLRKKIGSEFIDTIRGQGYRFTAIVDRHT